MVDKPVGHFLDGLILYRIDKGIRRQARFGFEIFFRVFAEAAFFALQFGDKLVAGVFLLLCVMGRVTDNLIDQLGKGNAGINHNRLHIGQWFKIIVEVHGIEDSEYLLVDLIAWTSRSTLHLFVEDSAFDRANEYEVTYEQIFSDNDTVLKIILSPIFIERIKKETDVPRIAVEQGIDIAKTETEETVLPVLVEKDTLIGKDNESVGSDGVAQLLEISFDNSSNKGEMVIFRLNDFYPPAVSAIEEEETPRVLCDFMDMQLAGEVNKEILAKGKYVQRIRTGLHGNPDNIRVILDLTPDRDYDLQQVFFKNDNLFVLIVNELSEVVSD